MDIIVACVLQQLLEVSTVLPVSATTDSRFRLARVPPTSLFEYITTIHERLPSVSESAFLHAAWNVWKHARTDGVVTLNAYTAHKLFAVALLCQHKLEDDDHYSNTIFAMASSISPTEFNQLEVAYLEATQFSLSVTMSEQAAARILFSSSSLHHSRCMCDLSVFETWLHEPLPPYGNDSLDLEYQLNESFVHGTGGRQSADLLPVVNTDCDPTLQSLTLDMDAAADEPSLRLPLLSPRVSQSPLFHQPVEFTMESSQEGSQSSLACTEVVSSEPDTESTETTRSASSLHMLSGQRTMTTQFFLHPLGCFFSPAYLQRTNSSHSSSSTSSSDTTHTPVVAHTTMPVNFIQALPSCVQRVLPVNVHVGRKRKAVKLCLATASLPSNDTSALKKTKRKAPSRKKQIDRVCRPTTAKSA